MFDSKAYFATFHFPGIAKKKYFFWHFDFVNFRSQPRKRKNLMPGKILALK